MPVADPEIVRILAHLVPKNLFVFSRNSDKSDGYLDRFASAYESARKTELARAERFSSTQGLSGDEFVALSTWRDELHELRFVPCDRKIGNFPNGEITVKVGTNVADRSIDVVVLFGEDVNEDCMELFLVDDALKRAGADRINVYAPFLPYTRQDRKDEGRVPISAKLLMDLIETSCRGGKCSLGRIVTIDLHAAQEQGFTEGPLDCLSMTNTLLARYLVSAEFKQAYGIDLKDIMLMSPDAGGVRRVERLARLLGVPYGDFSKLRKGPGEVGYDDHNRSALISRKNVIFIDDLIDSGGTIVDAADALRKWFAVSNVFAYGTHGVFSYKEKDGKIIRAEQRLKDSKVVVMTSDSIPRSQKYYDENSGWLQVVLSTAKPLANMALLRRLGFSVSEYMSGFDAEVRDAVTSGKLLSMDGYLVRSATPELVAAFK
jgi:ribose-phosphate pyrophosphokinase